MLCQAGALGGVSLKVGNVRAINLEGPTDVSHGDRTIPNVVVADGVFQYLLRRSTEMTRKLERLVRIKQLAAHEHFLLISDRG